MLSVLAQRNQFQVNPMGAILIFNRDHRLNPEPQTGPPGPDVGVEIDRQVQVLGVAGATGHEVGQPIIAAYPDLADTGVITEPFPIAFTDLPAQRAQILELLIQDP
ncbi:Uncharacterised protein [Mycobacteroides abscessus subsp. abscessus]|nr:Uncharacterised protein [Mycobacteroides abscessus subsp. abscessus]